MASAIDWQRKKFRFLPHRADATQIRRLAQDDIKFTATADGQCGPALRDSLGPATEKNGRLPNFDPSIATHQAPALERSSGFTLPANFPVHRSRVTQTSTAGLWAH